MKKYFIRIFIGSVLLLISVSLSLSWGFWAHKKINNMAIFTLPPEMIGFYKKHIDYLTEHAIDPDKRRYVVKEEGARHYLDLDHYGQHPFDSIPKLWKNAVAKYTEDTLMTYGIVPWYIETMMERLTEAFYNRDAAKILRLSADLGHYIADAHVPLHTTENYNGQFTNQLGIHGFWEARLPELLGDKYDFFVGRVQYIQQPLTQAWNILKASNSALDSVLSFEKKLNDQTSPDKKYSYEQRGAQTVKVYSEEYSRAYNEMLNDMAERRMRAAIFMVGSYWYTAWVNAGQPDLSKMKEKEQVKDVSDSTSSKKIKHKFKSNEE